MSGLAWADQRGTESPLARISCESTSVAVSLYRTGNGARLKLVSERTGAEVLLDATVLDALCALTPGRAVELVRQRTESAAAEPVT